MATAEKPVRRATSAKDRTLKLFRAFSDPTRLRLLALLHLAEQEGKSEVCVCDLTVILGAPQPTISRHLGYLRRLGLVACRREGPWCHYRLAAPDGQVHRALLKTLEACGLMIPEFESDARRLRTTDSCATTTSPCC